MKKEILDAFDSVVMPQECERKIRNAMKEKQEPARKPVRRLHPVAAALAVVVLMLSMSTEVRAVVVDFVENCRETSFFTVLTTGKVKRRDGGGDNTDATRRGIVIADKLNVRREASYDSSIVTSLHYGDRIEILEENKGWINIRDGWICKEYIYEDGTIGNRPAIGIVTSRRVNIRSGPGVDYEPVGSLNIGDRVNILEQLDYNDTVWACIGTGWISMNYVYVDGSGEGDAQRGRIIGSQLNIRSEPGFDHEPVGSLLKNEEVTVLFVLEIDDTFWGNIEQGWICMDYVELYE